MKTFKRTLADGTVCCINTHYEDAKRLVEENLSKEDLADMIAIMRINSAKEALHQFFYCNGSLEQLKPAFEKMCNSFDKQLELIRNYSESEIETELDIFCQEKKTPIKIIPPPSSN